jgi:hypothetical protein
LLANDRLQASLNGRSGRAPLAICGASGSIALSLAGVRRAAGLETPLSAAHERPPP